MANNITEYNATPGSNTTIDSISIDEGMAASNVNNAIRSLMSHLKNVDTGSQALTALSVTGALSCGAFTSNGIDDNADAVALTIDNDEKVLIGKTSSNLSTAGSEFASDGLVRFTRSNVNAVVNFNKLNNDGDIVSFRKDDTQIGSVGTLSNQLTIGRGGVGLLFDNVTSDAIEPHSMSSNAIRSDAIDLGTSSSRFKDLYLSGGVFLGGTGSANQISDYEEGNWTPAFDSGTGGYNGSALESITAFYRKIGNMVFLSASFKVTGGSNVSSGDSLEFTGQPFTPNSSIFQSRMGVSSINQSVGSGTMAVGVVASTSSNPGSMRAMIAEKSGTVSAGTAFTIINISYPTS